jgi:hypothetical protein
VKKKNTYFSLEIHSQISIHTRIQMRKAKPLPFKHTMYEGVSFLSPLIYLLNYLYLMTVNAQQVVDAQVHLGSLKNESHPKTSPYWAEVNNGLVVINPEIIAGQINKVHETLTAAKQA